MIYTYELHVIVYNVPQNRVKLIYDFWFVKFGAAKLKPVKELLMRF